MEDNIRNLYKQGLYKEIVDISRDSERVEFFNEWDYFYLLQSFYHLKEYDECLSLYKRLKKMNLDTAKYDSIMSWALFRSRILKYDMDKGSMQEFLRLVDYGITHCGDGVYSAKNCLANAAVNAIYIGKAKNTINYELAYKYLRVINPRELSNEEYVTNIKGKELKVSSAREKWYVRMTKTLEKLGRYRECLELVDEAFSTVSTFHTDNDKWLLYRKSKCLYKLNRLDEAEDLLREILKSHKKWIVYELMFMINRDKGNHDEALHNIALAALSDKGHDLRVTFYENAADYMYKSGMNHEADLHAYLSVLIRRENGWKGNMYSGKDFGETIMQMNMDETVKELTGFWESIKYKDISFVRGYISNILPNQKSGFIKSYDGGIQYYFQTRNFINPVKQVRTDQIVEFIPGEQYDKKKERMSPVATEIRIVR